MVSAALLAADWPQWRGPDRTGISKDTGLLQEWPKDGPPLRWQANDLGTGYSSPAVVGGRVYLQTTRDNEEFAVALDEKTGKRLWSAGIGKVGKNRARSTPAPAPRPRWTASGSTASPPTATWSVWSTRRARRTGARTSARTSTARSACGPTPSRSLIDGDALVCTPGGSKATLVALNKKTGDVVWKCAVPGGDTADYASVMAVDGGR